MSINSARDFIERVRIEPAFRKSGYAANSPAGFTQWILAQGFNFSFAEIDDAFRSMLLKAKDEACAEEIQELKNWYALLARPPETAKDCSTCGIQSSCGGTCSE